MRKIQKKRIPLIIAVENGREEVVKLLLDKQPNIGIDTKDDIGRTPLAL